MKVSINISPELLDMVEHYREDKSRSKFICDILKKIVIDINFTWDMVVKLYPCECPFDIYFDIIFDYVYCKGYPELYGEGCASDLCCRWENEGEYGKLKKEWFENSVKPVIDEFESLQSLLGGTQDYKEEVQ